MKKFLIATLLCMALTVTMVPMVFAADSNYTECMAAIQEQRTIQDQAHQTAESLRKKGYSDSSAYVQAAKSTWNEAQKAIAGYQKLAQYSDEAFLALSYAYPIQISDVAHYVGIDRSYLYRIFMEHENTSPKQYLLKHRLQMAAQLLCSSSCTITEAALSCGFRDAPSFCNYFRQGTGYTPKEFRKAYSGTIYT